MTCLVDLPPVLCTREGNQELGLSDREVLPFPFCFKRDQLAWCRGVSMRRLSFREVSSRGLFRNSFYQVIQGLR